MQDAEARPLQQVPQIKWVDLGLPSGTLWANTNLGAKSETDIGLFYQWADTQGYTYDAYMEMAQGGNLPPYKYYDYTNDEFTKYDSDDGLTMIQPEDDAAFLQLSDDTHYASLPFSELFEELIADTTSSATKVNDVQCIKFTGANDKYILFPLLYIEDMDMYIDGSWLDSLHYEDGVGTRYDRAEGVLFISDGQDTNNIQQGGQDRLSSVLPIRPISLPMVQNLESFTSRAGSGSAVLRFPEAAYIIHWAYKHNISDFPGFGPIFDYQFGYYEDSAERVIYTSSGDKQITISLNSSYEIANIQITEEEPQEPML